jgi:ubiquinone/menaquinone biosynthesis C-methylase UbiE
MTTTVGTEFDGIAEIYDSTRQPVTEAELKALSNELAECSIILDVGVGTGRFAKPLLDLGFMIVGIDFSLKMMVKAIRKGVQNLVLADAHQMPFRDKSFDASIIVHVLHLIPDWRNVTSEMGRVTRNKVVALLTNRQREFNKPANLPGYERVTIPPFHELWKVYAQIREEMGYPIRRNRRMWQNEEEIRSEIPPVKLVIVSDEVIVMSINDLIQRFRLRSYPMHENIPPEVHEKIIQRLQSSITQDTDKGKGLASTLKEKKIERRIVEELAVWRPNQLHQE